MSASLSTNGVMIKYLLTMPVAQNVEMLHVLNIRWTVGNFEYVSMVRLIEPLQGSINRS